VKVGSIEVSTDASPDHPFYDADVAFTGTLLSMERAQAMQLVAERGGRPRTTVSRFTEYLVVGSVEYKSLLTGAPSRKMQWSCPVSVDTWKLGRCG
jgi:DNA polymerase-3 subunit epsilon